MANELDGKVAAVTGAASGIALASAEAMVAAGAPVRSRRAGRPAPPPRPERRGARPPLVGLAPASRRP